MYSSCSVWFNLWPLIAMGSFLVIRIMELNNLDVLLTSKRILALFLGLFLPVQLILTILGFRWFFEAAKSKCMRTEGHSQHSQQDDGMVYFLVLILAMMRTFMLIMLGSVVLA